MTHIPNTLGARVWLGWGLAVTLPVLALLVRMPLSDSFTGFPFITFFPAVIVTAFVGGWRASAASSVLSGVLAWYYLIEPLETFELNRQSLIGLGFYALAVVFLNWLIESLVRANAQLKTAAYELEYRVETRTRDLQEAMRVKDAVEAQNRQLQKMETIGHLTGGLAHDFNNMLMIILSNLDMAKRRLAKGETNVAGLLDNATAGADRAAALTHRLLAFARKQPLDPSSVDANALISDMSEFLRSTLGENVVVECILAGGLWRTFIDQAQLENAIVNLAVNARDAMLAGGKLTIETANAFLDQDYAATHLEVTAGQYVLITVSDTGTGIAPDLLANIFEPFFTTKEAGQGTGLGLSQVFGYIKQSQGHIAVYSELGVGTSFKLYLPRDPRHAGSLSPARRLDVNQTLPRGLGERILVVEDDAQVRVATLESLRELGYAPQEADGADAALELLRTHAFDLLLTDVVMPGLNGRQLADAARTLWPDLKVLFTTGYSRNAIVHNGILDSEVALISKPYTLIQLARKLREVLDER